MQEAGTMNYRQLRILAREQQQQQQPSSLSTLLPPQAIAPDDTIPAFNYRLARIAARQATVPSKSQEPDLPEAAKEPDLRRYRLQRVQRILENSLRDLLKPGFLRQFPVEKLQQMFPLNWNIRYDAAPLRNATFTRHVLQPHDPEYNEVHQKFRATCHNRVTRIDKIEHPYLWLMYRLRKIEFSLLLGSRELLLFHGTKSGNVDSIVKDNFNWRYAGRSAGTACGRGVYFASAASTSAGYCSSAEKTMFLARVLFARNSVGHTGTTIPQLGCDATGNGVSVYVKYGDHEYFPQYVIHFQ